MKEDVYKSLGPSWQTCMTVNSSLARGLENTLKLLRKASVAKNTWRFLSVDLLQIYYWSSLTSQHDNQFILLLLMVFPFSKAAFKHLTGPRGCIHRGSGTKEGDWVTSTGRQDKLRILWRRWRPFGADTDCQMRMTFPMGYLLTSAPFTLVRILGKNLQTSFKFQQVLNPDLGCLSPATQSHKKYDKVPG